MRKGGEAMIEKEKEEVIRELEEKLPRFVFRDNKLIAEYTGLSTKYLANLDQWGKGPKRRVKIGKKIAYPRQELIEFIVNRITEK